MADFINGFIGSAEAQIFKGTPGLPGSGETLKTGSLPEIADIAKNSGVLGSLGLDGGGKLTATDTNNVAGVTNFADYFFRAVIIILGFIFMAVGLSMFKPSVIIERTAHHAKKAFT